ncbi:VOC family protein [Glutamicibacter sp. M10]|uniref:VOC family protein n=1 Tax=Glutamicibacter sp. M10 TaxID=3023076 RepID=UPI0021C74F7C|nr:VOC family protein [Glutamicibacter sp. M10]UXN32106.1 VOC family protein [Glutamicibacter sp. M10]
MASVLSEISIDCANPVLLARFWSEALDYRVFEEEVGLISIGPQSQEVFPVILTFAQVPEAKTIKNRLHLDVSPRELGQQQEVDRLLSLGASYADVGQDVDVSWVVLADPEGNEFCVLAGKDYVAIKKTC